MILGGHDHIHLVEQKGDTYVIKSGTDFREFNIINLKILPRPLAADVLASPEKHPSINTAKLFRERLVINTENIQVTSKWKPDSAVEAMITKYMKEFELSMDKVTICVEPRVHR